MTPENKKADIERLNGEISGFRIQGQLLDRFVDMARSSSDGDVLTSSLQQTLDLATELTGAESGSIFLLNEAGVVTDSILSRQLSKKATTHLLGRIMNKGLAGWVYKHKKLGLIQDTDRDERWLPLDDQPYPVGSALAVPIMRDEVLFGILTLIHSRKNHFNAALIDTIQGTADQMALVLDNVKVYVELAKAKAAADTYSRALNLELEKGRKIQQDFLPAHLPQVTNLKIAAKFIPALQVSGDFYDAFALSENQVGMVLGDVSDKGVGAALYMALIRSFVRMFANQCNRVNPEQSAQIESTLCLSSDLQRSALMALDITNDYLASEHDAGGMFATLFFGIINTDTGLLRYINAGHLPVYLIIRPGKLQLLGPTGPAVGLQGGIQYPYKEIELPPRSLLFGYTDGITEALSPTGEMYQKSRLENLLCQTPVPPADELVRQVHRHLLGFMDNEIQSDDITMLAAQWMGRDLRS